MIHVYYANIILGRDANECVNNDGHGLVKNESILGTVLKVSF